MLDVGIKVDMFFDSPKVQRAISRQKRRVLVRAGGFGRTTMKRSIRRAPKKKKYTPTPPYPRYHVKSGLNLRSIFFSYDVAKESVVIGPVEKKRGPTNTKQRKVTYNTNAAVPRILNTGLKVKRIIKYRKSGKTERQLLKYRTFDFSSRALVPAAAKLSELTAKHGLI